MYEHDVLTIEQLEERRGAQRRREARQRHTRRAVASLLLAAPSGAALAWLLTLAHPPLALLLVAMAGCVPALAVLTRG